MSRPKNNKEAEGIRRMVHLHLRRRAQTAPPPAAEEHLDDDLFSAFTEGRLNEGESAPVLKHLVACSFCRHITAQLVRLDLEVGETKDSLPVVQEDPGRIRRLLDDLGSRVFAPSDDEAVFAYHAPEEDTKPKDGADFNRDGVSEETNEKLDAESNDKA